MSFKLKRYSVFSNVFWLCGLNFVYLFAQHCIKIKCLSFLSKLGAGLSELRKDDFSYTYGMNFVLLAHIHIQRTSFVSSCIDPIDTTVYTNIGVLVRCMKFLSSVVFLYSNRAIIQPSKSGAMV